MAWHTGKTALAVANIGDSNAYASGGFAPNGGQVLTAGAYCYVSESGQVPYDEANLGWYNVDPNGPERTAEYASYLATTYATDAYIGQALNGNGNPGMQTNNMLKAGTGIDSYLYQCAVGGTTAQYWAEGNGWTTLLRTIPAALASIPGSPTAFDCITMCLGTNDCIQDVTAEQFYQYMKTFRANMAGEGWWVPGVTQIVLLDIPRNGVVSGDGGTYPDSWFGLKYVRSRFRDRIAMTSSIDYSIDPTFPVHFLPPSYTDAGRQAGEKFLRQVPLQAANVAVGGKAVRIGGRRVRAHSWQ